jgi:transcriptional regulator with XRE-family HTH domain
MILVINSRNITGKMIKSIRANKCLSQYELVNKLSLAGIRIDQTILSRIENQTREVLDFEAKAIADALEVNIEDLFDE